MRLRLRPTKIRLRLRNTDYGYSTKKSKDHYILLRLSSDILACTYHLSNKDDFLYVDFHLHCMYYVYRKFGLASSDPEHESD